MGDYQFSLCLNHLILLPQQQEKQDKPDGGDNVFLWGNNGDAISWFREQHVKFLWSVIRLLLLLIFDMMNRLNLCFSCWRWLMIKAKGITNLCQQSPLSVSTGNSSLQSCNTEFWLSPDQWQYQMNSTRYSFISCSMEKAVLRAAIRAA